MAAYEVLLLNTAIPQIQAAQAGDTYVVPRDIAFSTVASLAAGTEALPSLVATGDVNTGFWFPAADTIAASTGGTRRLTLDSSGRLQIATTNSTGANAKLVVGAGLAGQNGIAVINTGDVNVAGLSISNWTGSATSNKVVANFDSSGVGGFSIGMPAATNAFYIYDEAAATERARITSGGDLLVGSPTAFISGTTRLQVYHDSYPAAEFSTGAGALTDVAGFWNKATSGDNQFAGFYTETSPSRKGSITYNRAGGLVAYNTTSDYRAKDIIGPVTDAGVTIDALKVYNGKMKGATVERPMLIAHEAQEVTPYAVTGEKDAVDEDGKPKYQQMDVSSLVPLLIAELQSLRARVAQLEAK